MFHTPNVSSRHQKKRMGAESCCGFSPSFGWLQHTIRAFGWVTRIVGKFTTNKIRLPPGRDKHLFLWTPLGGDAKSAACKQTSLALCLRTHDHGAAAGARLPAIGRCIRWCKAIDCHDASPCGLGISNQTLPVSRLTLQPGHTLPAEPPDQQTSQFHRASSARASSARLKTCKTRLLTRGVGEVVSFSGVQAPHPALIPSGKRWGLRRTAYRIASGSLFARFNSFGRKASISASEKVMSSSS